MLLDGVPVFPLPETQLFPHALLPLHVFEPRYRALAHDCLAGERRIAIAMLAPGFENDYEGRPPIVPICGVGEIVAHHEHPDGRYEILVRGVARVRVLEELPPERLYRMARATVLEDLYRPGVDLAMARQSLVIQCDRLALILPSGGDTLRALARQEEDPASAADVLAAALVTDPRARQELIETLDVAARLDRVAEVVAAVFARLQAAGGPPPPN